MLPRQTLIPTLICLFLLAPNLTGAEERNDARVPEDSCIVTLTLPDGATVTVDGEDYGTQRRFAYGPLKPRTRYEYEFAVHYPSGEASTHTLLLEGGRRVHLAKPDPAVAAPELVLQYGHEGAVNSVAFSPDGRTFATGSGDKTAILWEARTGRKLRTFEGHSLPINSIAFSPDGRTMVTGGEDRTAMLWDVKTGRALRTLRGHTGNICSVAYGPDGQTVLTSSFDKTVILWDAKTGRRLHTFAGHSKQASVVAFSPDGRTVLIGCFDTTATLWDVRTGRKLRTFAGHSGPVIPVAFSPDGKTISTASFDRTAILWDVKTGTKLRTFEEHSHWIVSVAFSPDGRTMATGSFDNTAILWDLETGRKLRTFQGHSGWISSVAFSPDGRTLLTGSRDQTAILWDVETGKKVKTLSGQPGLSVALSPDGRTVLTGRFDQASDLWDTNLWDAKTGRKIRSFQKHPDRTWPLTLSPDGQTAMSFSRNKASVLWDVKTGEKISALEGNSDRVLSAVFSPDGRTVLTGSLGKTVAIWDVKTGTKLRTFEGKSVIKSAVFSPDGRTLLTGYGYRTMTLWDVGTGRKLRTFEEDESSIKAVAFSPDGKTVSAVRADGTMVLWDVGTSRKLRTFEEESNGIRFVTFSPDGETLMTNSGGNRAILRDVKTGRKLRTFEEKTAFIQDIRFGPDGRTIITTSLFGTTKVWSIATGEILLTRQFVDNANGCLITTPEGLFDGSRGAINRICYRIGDGLNVLPVDQFFDGFYAPGLTDAILGGERPLPQVDAEIPPAIRIVSPDSGDTTEKEEVTVEAVIEDQGGGIGRPVVKLDGNRYLVDDAPVRENDKRLRWRFTIPLIRGVENTIEVHSATASGAVAGEPGRITVRCEKPKEQPELYMVAVGISDYADGGPRDLECARNDAEGLARVFRRRGEPFYGSGRVHVTTVVDEQATKKGIEEAIASAARSAKPRDVFILTLAGHGVTLGQRYYFIPHDYDGRGEEWHDEKIRRQGLPEDELDDWIASVPATKRILVYDTCQSGAALSRNAGYEKTLESLARRSGCHVIAAASSNKDAEELPDVGHGALTYALMAGLGAADKGLLKGRSARAKDGLVHAVEWFRFASETVPNLTKLHLGKEQYVEFKSQAADFPILPLKTKENRP